jgi:hypothetical protein
VTKIDLTVAVKDIPTLSNNNTHDDDDDDDDDGGDNGVGGGSGSGIPNPVCGASALVTFNRLLWVVPLLL